MRDTESERAKEGECECVSVCACVRESAREGEWRERDARAFGLSRPPSAPSQELSPLQISNVNTGMLVGRQRIITKSFYVMGGSTSSWGRACKLASLSLCLFVSLSLCVFVSLSLCLFVSLSLCLSVSLALCLFVSLSLRLFGCGPAARCPRAAAAGCRKLQPDRYGTVC